MNDFIVKLDEIFGKKAPQLPVKFKEILVKFAPYLIILGLVLSVFGLLLLIPLMLGGAVILGASAYAMMYGGSMTKVFIAFVFGVVSVVLEFMALSGLFKRTHKAWNLLFYANLVSLLSMLISFNLIGLVISGLISFYILFQIRPYYVGLATISQSSTSSTPSQTPPSVPPTSV